MTQLRLEFVHPANQAAAVDFELRFTGTPGANPTTLLRERHTSPTESGKAIAQQCQLHLRSTLRGASVLGKDIQDDCRAVNRRSPESLLEISLLGRAQIVVKNDGINVKDQALLKELGDLPRPKKGRWIGGITALNDLTHHICACRRDKFSQFFELGVEGLGVNTGEKNSHQNDPLPERAVDQGIGEIRGHRILSRGTNRSAITCTSPDNVAIRPSRTTSRVPPGL